MTDEIIVQGRGRDQCTSWRVRHDGTHYYVERGRVRRHRAEWFVLACYPSQDNALAVFAAYARAPRPPSPVGFEPPLR
jgi:hypothetical protein